MPRAVGRATVSLLLFDCLPKIKSEAGERERAESGEMREKEQFD